MIDALLGVIVRELVTEALAADSAFAMQVWKGLRNVAAKFKSNPEYFYSVCEKDAEGFCVSFPGHIVNVPNLGNVVFLLWYSVTDDRANDNLMYFSEDDDAKGDIGELDRTYEFSIGRLPINARVPSPLTPERVNMWIAKNLFDELGSSRLRAGVFHEVGHLQSLRKQTTAVSRRLWTTFSKDKSVQGGANWAEPYASVMEQFETIYARYDGRSAQFQAEFPTAQSFVEYVWSLLASSFMTDMYTRGSKKKLQKLAASVWQDLVK